MKYTITLVLSLMMSCNGGRMDSARPEKSSEAPGVELFAPGLFSTGLNELNATFSPDGSCILYTIANNSSSNTFYTIFISHKQNGGWSAPIIAPFSGQFSDADPFFAPEGNRVYFISLRPKSGYGQPRADFDIWTVTYEGNRWLTPQHLGDSVNTDKDELYPAVSRTGNLFFSRETENSYDILMSSQIKSGFTSAAPVQGELNTRAIEYDAYVSPDESYMIFTSIGREDSMGSGDLYISYNNNGTWSEGRNLGERINSSAMDQCPSMSSDGATFLFTSFRDNNNFSFKRPIGTAEYYALLSAPFNGLGNIFSVSSGHILDTPK